MACRRTEGNVKGDTASEGYGYDKGDTASEGYGYDKGGHRQ